MSQEPDSGVETDAERSPARAPRVLGAGARWVLTALLAAVLAGALVFGVTSWRTERRDDTAASDRRDALSVAEQFTLRLDSLNYQDIPAYRTRLNGLLTTKMKTDFAGSFKGFGTVFKSIEFASSGTVRTAGIADIDSDSATVLVIHDVAVKSKGCVQPPYKRMTVDLRKVQGRWLVDDFQEGVPGCQG